jgi:hypothetical protein
VIAGRAFIVHDPCGDWRGNAMDVHAGVENA